MSLRLCKTSFVLAIVLPIVVMSGWAKGAKPDPVLSGDWTTYAAYNLSEVNGPNFSVSFPGLPAGAYTVEVESAELYYNRPGARVMDVSCGSDVIAKDWDVFKEAGGVGKPMTESATVQHANDDISGPLAVVFKASVNHGEFILIRVRDGEKNVVAMADAAKIKNSNQDFGTAIPKVEGPEIWRDPDQTPEVRAADLVRRLSLREKVGELGCGARAIKRLGIPAYNWESEALHCVLTQGVTVFPQPIGGAASFDDALWKQAGDAVSTEARAKFNERFRRQGETSMFQGITMSSPNINIFRDPRWGRGHETYGEDPYLTARMGVAYIEGLQGDDPRYIKVAATVKHFAVHSGPDALRHVFNATASDQDLWETYLPAFEAGVIEAKACTTMGAYSEFRGESCSSSKLLLEDILRDRWGFKGYVISDMDSVSDIWRTHHLETSAAAASARAIKNGMDMCMGDTFNSLTDAVSTKLCTEADVDRALIRSLAVRFRLGLFDPPEKVKYAQIPPSACDTPEHDALALRCAQESMVLLKNTRNLLPLEKKGTVAVIGPNAACTFKTGWMDMGMSTQYGNYSGKPTHPINVLDGIRKKLGGKASVLYAQGCTLTSGDDNQTADALAVARQADVVVMVMGLSATDDAMMEGEGHDRSNILLPDAQEKLIREMAGTGKPVVLVLMGGSSLAIDWDAENIPAILDAWYPGQRGDAVADVLFGDINPAGRLPITFYKSENDLPAFADYSMKGRTYRYFEGKPLFPFGFGLSYTTFAYADMKIEPGKNGSQSVSVNVKNTGSRAGDEVVQLYISRKDSTADEGLPIHALRGFRRVSLDPGAEKTVVFHLTPFQFAFVGKDGVRSVEAGAYMLGVGGSQEAAMTTTVTIGQQVVNAPYSHQEPEVLSMKTQH